MQTNNIDLKNIWKQQKTANPNLEELNKKLKDFNRKNRYKIVLVNILIAVTIGIIIYMWYALNPKLLTTKAGMILGVLAMIFFIFFYNKLFYLYKNTSDFVKSKAYVQNLITLKKKQKHLQTKILSIYFVLLSLGVGLYMYEFTQRMSTFWQFFSFAIITLWFGFNWFYIRPRIIRKQQQKIDKLITEYERINSELND